MGDLALGQERDLDGDPPVAVLGDELVHHRHAELLHPGLGLREPVLGNTDHLVPLWVIGYGKGGRVREAGRRMGLTYDLEDGREARNVGGDGPINGAGDAVIRTGSERHPAVARLQTEYAAEGRRNSDAASAIASKGEWNEAGADSICTPGRAATSVVLVVVGVLRGSVDGIITSSVYRAVSGNARRQHAWQQQQ